MRGAEWQETFPGDERGDDLKGQAIRSTNWGRVAAPPAPARHHRVKLGVKDRPRFTIASAGGLRYSRVRGEVAEWFKAAVLKTVEAGRLPGVRIPSSPPPFRR